MTSLLQLLGFTPDRAKRVLRTLVQSLFGGIAAALVTIVIPALAAGAVPAGAALAIVTVVLTPVLTTLASFLQNYSESKNEI